MRHTSAALAAVLSLAAAASTFAQADATTLSSTTAVERLLRTTGVYRPADGTAPAAVESAVLAIYDREVEGTALWEETQSVTIESDGRYTVLLGLTTNGLPAELFATSEPRWLSLHFQRPGEPAPARTLITGAPYAVKALKAADADTLGGLPASAFQLAGNSRASASATSARSASAGTAVGGSVVPLVNTGTLGRIGKFVTTADLGDSVMFESSGRIGLGTTGPLDLLHVAYTNTDGSLTGLAVQNLSNSATAYSGMLFYDQSGALGQFQGFNNSTHEYRINNIASGGSINFMLGSASKFRLNSSGNVEVAGTLTSTGTGNVVLTGGELEPLGTQADGIRWLDGTGTIQAHLHRFGAVDNRLYVTNAGSSDLTGVYLASGATAWTSTSDERLKTGVVPVTDILDKIKKIRVVAFDMASMSVDRATGKPVVNRDIQPRTMRDGTVIKQQIGTIAQDWLADFPELVVEPRTDEQYYGLSYERIGIVALGGVKELSNQLTEKEAEIQALNARLVALEQRLAEQSAHTLE